MLIFTHFYKLQNLSISFSKNPNGYINIMGIIIQWGTATSITTVTFPIKFSTKVFTISTTRIGGVNEHSMLVSNVSNSSFYTECRGYKNENKSTSFYWLAIGY